MDGQVADVKEVSGVELREIRLARLRLFAISLGWAGLVAVSTFPLDLLFGIRWVPNLASAGTGVVLVSVNLLGFAHVSSIREAAQEYQPGDYGRHPRREVEIAPGASTAWREPSVTFATRRKFHRVTVTVAVARAEVRGHVPFWVGADGGYVYELVTRLAE